MKCPKCAYLGYESVERCRNCGYEFALGAGGGAEPELRLHERADEGAGLDDLALHEGGAPLPSGRASGRPRTPTPSEMLASGLDELPLFGGPAADDEPLIRQASAPRQPLSVRRATPEVPRLRGETRAPMLDWSEPTTGSGASSRPAPQPANIETFRRRRATPEPAPVPVEVEDEPATLGSRALASAVDVGLLAVVDIVVIYFTMKICRLPLSDIALLPKAPLVAFLILQNVGYLIAFTASGQTLGKMIAGVRVLSNDTDDTPDVASAAMRAAVWVVLALPAGLGLLTAGLSRDGRGLHDRFAGTRVVRAGA